MYTKNKKSGQAMLTAVVLFMVLGMFIISGLVAPTILELSATRNLLKGKQSFYLSESGVEDAYYRFITKIPIDSTEILTLGNDTATTTIVDAGNKKTITAVGDVLSRKRTNTLVLVAGTGKSFNYGVESGKGGLTMGNGSKVNGSVYANGPITGSGTITGSASSANLSALVADQVNDEGTPAYDVIFGNANNTQDFAQSFQVSTTDVVNKVELYLKKVSTPSDLTVRIVTNSGGSPGTTTLASGSLSASLISTNYGWVSVPLSSNPELTAGITYWIVVDASTSSSKYYMIGANNNGYANGMGKIGKHSGTWNNTTPSGLDGFFRLYLGGITGLISGITIGEVGNGNGGAYAHTVNNSTIAGNNYCQTGAGNNKPCDTSLADPTQVPMPISEQNILDWKNSILADGGTHNGDYVVDGKTTSYGPKKIVGNLYVKNGADLTLNGALWVTGNVNVYNNAKVRLSTSYGASDSMIIADGLVFLSNNAQFYGSGTTDSYIMVLSTSDSTSAITLSNNVGAAILYAGNGTIDLVNNASATSLNGYHINMQNNSNIYYDSGIVNSNFVAGPSGGWSVESWRETE